MPVSRRQRGACRRCIRPSPATHSEACFAYLACRCRPALRRVCTTRLPKGFTPPCDTADRPHRRSPVVRSDWRSTPAVLPAARSAWCAVRSTECSAMLSKRPGAHWRYRWACTTSKGRSCRALSVWPACNPGSVCSCMALPATNTAGVFAAMRGRHRPGPNRCPLGRPFTTALCSNTSRASVLSGCVTTAACRSTPTPSSLPSC